MISSDLLQSIIFIISSKTGIKIREQDEANLQQKLSKRIKVLGLRNDHEYLAILNSSSLTSSAEWDKLITLITTGESYFFRDRGQINLIKEQIFPDLIEMKQDTKTLNILSAGCSSGEEVYSLAIVLGEVMSHYPRWNINVVGIDLNAEAIAKAKKGVYSEWSFRGVDPHYRSVYFRQKLEGWEVTESIKQQVKFYQSNLVEEEIPFFPIGSVDLIICRNVFIYFDRDNIALVLAKFIALLHPGGFLLTGHTELQEQEVTPLKVLSYPESLVYRMPLSHAIETIPPTVLLPNLKELGQQAFNEGKYKDTIGYLQDWLNLNSQDEDAILMMARAYANQGYYVQTEKLCNDILQQNHCCVNSLLLLAQIAEEQGKKEEAKDYLRRILFINANFIPAYLDLIDLHLSDREHEQAQTLLTTLQDMMGVLSAEYELRFKAIKLKLEDIRQKNEIFKEH